MNAATAFIDFIGTPGDKPGVRVVHAYAYIVPDESAGKRPTTFLRSVLDKLPREEEGSLFKFGQPDMTGDVKLYFRLIMATIPVPNDAEAFYFGVDRKRFDGCPLSVSSTGMEVHAMLKRLCRMARKSGAK